MPDIAARPRRQATKGVRNSAPSDYRIMVVCRFNDADFALVDHRAKANNISFAAEVRALIKWALITAPKVKHHA